MHQDYLQEIRKVSIGAFEYLTALTDKEKKKINWSENGVNVDDSFTWRKTPQGGYYWDDINERVNKNINRNVSYELLNICVAEYEDMTGGSFYWNQDDGVWTTHSFCQYPYDWFCISPSDPSRISAVFKDPFPNGPSDIEREEDGVFLKTGKFVSRLFPSLAPDQASLLGSRIASRLRYGVQYDFSNFELSSTPSEIYTTEHSGMSSCMCGQPPHWFALYDQLPNCRILYKVNEVGRVIGRALVWDEVEVHWSNNLITLMDRVYFNNDTTLQEFLKYAACQGWYSKKNQAIGCLELRTPQEWIISDCELSIQVKAPLELSAVPYMDTFCFYERRKGYPEVLHNDEQRYRSGRYKKTEFRETDGSDSRGGFKRGEEAEDCTLEDPVQIEEQIEPPTRVREVILPELPIGYFRRLQPGDAA